MDFIRLNVDTIEGGLTGRSAMGKIVLYESTASTNDVAWAYASNPDNHGLCVFAEQQTRGRGRRGNTWHSRPGQAILCSLLLKHDPTPANIITLAAAVGAAQAIRNITHCPAMIKWPNDLLISDKKLGGILVESRPTPHGHDYVIGIGINCNQTRASFTEPVFAMPATSLQIESGSPIDRNRLAIELICHLEQALNTASQDKTTIIEQWQRLSSQLGNRVTLEHIGQRYHGTCIGLDPTEGLILQIDDGPIRAFPARQTTIVKT